MSLTTIVALLQSALLLLTAVQSGTNLPQSFRDNATEVAHQAISEATLALTSSQTTISSTPNTTNETFTLPNGSVVDSLGNIITPAPQNFTTQSQQTTTLGNSTASNTVSPTLTITLGQTTPTLMGVYISWNTSIPSNAKVFLTQTPVAYNASSTQIVSSAAGYSTQGSINVSNLLPNTQYSYTIEATNGTQDQKLTGIFTTSNYAPVSLSVSSYSGGPSVLKVNMSNSLGGYTITTSAPISAGRMVFHVTSTNQANDSLTNVYLSDGNNIIGGPVDEANGTLTFIGPITLQNGLYLNGTVARTGQNGDTIQISTNPTTDWFLSAATPGTTISAPNISITASNPLTIAAPTLSVNLNQPQQPPSTVVVGSQNAIMAYITLNADNSRDGIRMTSIPLDLTTTGNTASTLNNCQLWSGGGAMNGSVQNTSNGQTFNIAPLGISAGDDITLTLKCNISANATPGSTVAWGINQNDNWYATGMVSGVSIVPTVQTTVGQTITISSQ